MTLAFRPACAEDLERLVAIHTSAFPDGRAHEARVRKLTTHPLGPLEDLWVAERRGVVLAHAFLFRLQAWFGGKRVPVGGIATVGVAPEARGQGVGAALLAHLHAQADDRRDALTVLHPFRQAFYAPHGYAATSRVHALAFSPHALPRSSAELAVRAALGTDRSALEACWESSAREGTGKLARSEASWSERLTDERRVWLVAEGADGVEGYVSWSLHEAEPREATTLFVHELAARSDRALRSLWRSIAAQRDQVHRVEVEVALDDPMAWALVDADRGAPGGVIGRGPVGTIASGPMIRATDPARALASRGWPRPGSMVIGVGDARFAVTARDGEAMVEPTRVEADLTTGARTFASVVFGGVSVRDAARLGLLTARDEPSLARVGALLAIPPYFSADRF